jgi:hypothetical protein
MKKSAKEIQHFSGILRIYHISPGFRIKIPGTDGKYASLSGISYEKIVLE